MTTDMPYRWCDVEHYRIQVIYVVTDFGVAVDH